MHLSNSYGVMEVCRVVSFAPYLITALTMIFFYYILHLTKEAARSLGECFMVLSCISGQLLCSFLCHFLLASAAETLIVPNSVVFTYCPSVDFSGT